MCLFLVEVTGIDVKGMQGVEMRVGWCCEETDWGPEEGVL